MSLESEVARTRAMYAERDTDPAVQAMWSPFAEGEVAHRTRQYFAMAALFRSIGRLNLSGLRILDVGCGQGRQLRAYLDMGASPENLVGVDVRSNAIEEARFLSPHLDFRVSDGIDLNFPVGYFDLVTQFVVFSSIFAGELRQHLAGEMRRVLKPGGYIFWWDLKRTEQRGSAELLQPPVLFPGVEHRELHVGLQVKPSACVRLPRRLERWRQLLDRFGYPDTHIADLIGPKP